MVLTLPKHLQPPKQSVLDVMTHHGYVISSSTQYDIMVYAPGTTRDALRDGKEPLVGLTYNQVQQIQDMATTEEDVLLAVASIIETGALPDRLQGRIDRAVQERSEHQERRIKELESQLATLLKTMEDAAPPKAGKKSSKNVAAEAVEATQP